MTIQESQARVDAWIQQYGVRYFSELTNMAVLTEEVGEVARVAGILYQAYHQGHENRAGMRRGNAPGAAGPHPRETPLRPTVCERHGGLRYADTDPMVYEAIKKGLSKKIGVKIFDSNFFHGNNIHGEIPCNASVSRFDRIFRNCKKDCCKKKSFCDSPLLISFRTRKALRTGT